MVERPRVDQNDLALLALFARAKLAETQLNTTNAFVYGSAAHIQLRQDRDAWATSPYTEDNVRVILDRVQNRDQPPRVSLPDLLTQIDWNQLAPPGSAGSIENTLETNIFVKSSTNDSWVPSVQHLTLSPGAQRLIRTEMGVYYIPEETDPALQHISIAPRKKGFVIVVCAEPGCCAHFAQIPENALRQLCENARQLHEQR